MEKNIELHKFVLHKVVKPKPMPESNSRNVKEVIIPPNQKEEILNELRKVL